MSNCFEGLSILLEEDFTIEISPKMSRIDLDNYDIKSLQFKYEERHCGCCEGGHEVKEFKPEDIFDFVDSGGIQKVKELQNKLEDKDKEVVNLKKEIKEYKNVLNNLKENGVSQEESE